MALVKRQRREGNRRVGIRGEATLARVETRVHAVAAAALICLLPAAPQATSLRAAGTGTAPCGGAAITPDQVISGSFGKPNRAPT